MKNTPSYRGNGYDDVHAKRFELSLQTILANVTTGAKILELGGGGHFTEVLRSRGFDVTIPTGDFRYEVFPSGFDAALCMEVIEHIHDQEADIPTEWRGTGVDNMMSAMFQALRPGGFLLLTTPNADSLNVINKLIHRQGPMVYRPHVREYTVHELVGITRKVGFTVTLAETHECWDNSMSPEWRQKITRLIVDHYGMNGMINRGEDIFVLAKKPE